MVGFNKMKNEEIIIMSSIMGTTDFDALYKTNYNYSTELFLFYGIFIAFAIKTPTIFLNTHVESPLSGSIILAAISMVALNLANCWKHLAHIFTRSISRKLYAFTETKGYLTYIF
ncbi:NADH-ubiquinone oxidoreductase chain 4 [Erysiphe neolycopersici]|uniref:NADH-ubiquinone oxidoreductase chain 4 n=1 Tax=Erysiphe neolycopersici TaxID=212602 RepID=A0A420HY98_9PEZI|nr:NADH-ubiquinone oxidoreductase chain 4 [Erysiphe neolycopersici]